MTTKATTAPTRGPDLLDFPAFAQWQARADDLAAAVRQAADRLAEQIAANRAAHEAWQAEVREAHTRREPGPPHPPPAEDVAPTHRLMADLRRQAEALEADQVRVLASIAPDVEAAWAQALPDLARRTSLTPVGELTARLAEVREWRVALRRVRRAVETSDPNARQSDGPSTRMLPRIDLADLLALAQGIDLCAPRDPHPAPDQPTRVNPDEDDYRAMPLGLQPYRAFGTRPEIRAPSTPPVRI